MLKLAKWSGILVGSLALLSAGSYVGIRQYIHNRLTKALPGATYASMSLDWDRVSFKGLAFNKGWVYGRLETVIVTYDQSVMIHGGEVTVNLQNRPKATGTSKAEVSIWANDLTVHAQLKPGFFGDFLGCRWDGKTASFSSGSLYRGKDTFLLKTGNYYPLSQMVTVESASTLLPFPEVPLLKMDKLPIEASGISAMIDTHVVDIKNLKAGPFTFSSAQFKESDDYYSVLAATFNVSFPWLYTKPLTFHNIGVSVNKDGKDILSNIKTIPIDYDKRSHQLQGKASCQTWLDALPVELRTPPLDNVVLRGDLSFQVNVKQPKFKLKASCKATCSTLPNLRQPFTYLAYYGQERKERTSGPGSLEWIPIGIMGRVPENAIRLEDPGYMRHTGVIPQALENSLIDDLQLNRFHRGGSTISMQLVKNIWLSRDKTIGRKIQEVFLAQAIESCYTKDEILELYLNVVEFGPSIYGLQAGSKHWFEKEPMQLSLVEAFWLASILPRPRTAAKPQDFTSIRALIERLTGEVLPPEDEEVPVDLGEWVAQQ